MTKQFMQALSEHSALGAVLAKCTLVLCQDCSSLRTSKEFFKNQLSGYICLGEYHGGSDPSNVKEIFTVPLKEKVFPFPIHFLRLLDSPGATENLWHQLLGAIGCSLWLIQGLIKGISCACPRDKTHTCPSLEVNRNKTHTPSTTQLQQQHQQQHQQQQHDRFFKTHLPNT